MIAIASATRVLAAATEPGAYAAAAVGGCGSGSGYSGGNFAAIEPEGQLQ